jgi:hypothetical protein
MEFFKKFFAAPFSPPSPRRRPFPCSRRHHVLQSIEQRAKRKVVAAKRVFSGTLVTMAILTLAASPAY